VPVARVQLLVRVSRPSASLVTAALLDPSHGNIHATLRSQYESGFSLLKENGTIPPCA